VEGTGRRGKESGGRRKDHEISTERPPSDDAAAIRDANTIRVLAAVIRRGDRWLVGRRPVHKRHGGLWEFPGGKLEAGESLLDAARRELAEELAVRVTRAGEVQFARRDPGSHFVIEFVDVEIDGEPVALEHEEVRWLALAEMAALDLAPSDRAFVDWLNG
jgi:8-oxo-dGTP diphosphatase